MPAKVIVADLRKRYGTVDAARGVSFEIEDGEVFGLLGPNGAGKTTVLECIVGLRRPDGGTIRICGIDARHRPFEAREKIGAVLQSAALQDKITPREALRLFGSFYRNRVEPEELLARFSLDDKADVPFDSLSGGQRQRLSLAMAFVNRPELVFLDEPTAGVDPQARNELYDEITRMREEGRTVLLTTHYIEEAERLCDRVALIDRGRIVATGTPRELIARSAAAPSVYLTTTRPIVPTRLANLPHLEDLSCEGTEIRFRTAEVRLALTDVMRALAEHSADVAELHVGKATLEHVFLEFTGGGGHE